MFWRAELGARVLAGCGPKCSKALCWAGITGVLLVLAGGSPRASAHPPDERRHLAAMIVVAPDAYAEMLAPFLVWKHRSGVPADLHLMSDIGMDAESLRKWLIQLSTFNTRDYVLLIGDLDSVPSIMIEDGMGAMAPSDFLYTDLDEDGEYGDCFIGRMPADSLATARMQIERSMDYERNYGHDPTLELDYLAHTSGLSSAVSAMGEPYDQRVDAALDELAGLGMVIDGRYHELSSDWTRAEFVADLEDGLGILVALSEGTPAGWQHLGGPSFAFGAEDIRALEHDSRWPLVIDTAAVHSSPGEPTRSMTHAWAWAGTPGAPQGALAHVTLSGDVGDGLSELVPQAMVEHFATGDARLGAAVAHARTRVFEQGAGSEGAALAQKLLTNYGDPSLVMRFAPPRPLQVSLPDEVSLSDPLIELEIKDAEGNPVVGALATVSFEDHFTASKRSDAAGQVMLWPLATGVEAGSVIDIVVSGSKWAAFEGQVTMVASDDDSSGESSTSSSDEGGETATTGEDGSQSDASSSAGDSQESTGPGSSETDHDDSGVTEAEDEVGDETGDETNTEGSVVEDTAGAEGCRFSAVSTARGQAWGALFGLRIRTPRRR